jgi:DNA-binding MarR family transcriptional regulator
MTLRDEIKQRRPFTSRRHEGALALLVTADLLRRRIAAAVEPHGITPQQYNVLRILRGAGKDGLPTLEIAERMIERTPGITRLVDRLEAQRLVTRKRVAQDRRQVFCTITPGGLQLLARLDGPIQAADEALGVLADHDVDKLIAILDALRQRWRAEERKTSPSIPEGGSR